MSGEITAMQVKFDWHMFMLGLFTLCVLIALAVG